MKKELLLEASVYSADGAKVAFEAGADRVELCDNISEGGTTPSYGMIRQTMKAGPSVFVIIRPRGGDFLYTSEEVEVMLADIEMCKQQGVHGVVIGALNADGSIDLSSTKRMVDAARPMQVTFHRAFDMCKDASEAVKQLADLGIERILTSGQRNTAYEGKELLQELQSTLPEGIQLLIGSGVNPGNLEELHDYIGADEYHMSAAKYVASEMDYRNPHIAMGNEEDADEFRKLAPDYDKIANARKVLDSIK